jgi:outer membrane protein
MKMITVLLLFFLNRPVLAAETFGSPEISLRKILDSADQYSPDLKASGARENAAQSQVGIAQSYYLPNLNFEAIDSTGFAGSSGALDVQGLMGSPYRSQFSAGFVLTQNIVDFGRTYYGVQTSKAEAKSEEKRTDIDRYQLDQNVIQDYFDCVLNRAQKETWSEIAKDSGLVTKEVDRFVRTGQRSVVDRYLADLQKEQALTQSANFETREKVSIQRLALVTGLDPDFRCPLLGDEKAALRAPQGENPIVAYARDQLDAANAKLSQSKTENLPKIVGIASAGYLQDTHFVQKQDYALGIGLEIPIFEGFRVKDQVNQNAALVDEKDYLVQASKLRLEDLNRQLDERIESASVRVDHLGRELKIAVDGFDLAKKRYLDFQGTLVDVRDSLNYLSNVKTELNASQADYLESKYLKDVLNGAR